MLNAVDISSDGTDIAVATQFSFYYINPRNPEINELETSIANASFGSFLGIGIMGIIAFIRSPRKSEIPLDKE
jgi:hypothetical protein